MSDESIYLLKIEDKLGYDNLRLFETLERSRTDVEVHGRVFNRTVTLSDSTNDRTYELEAPRMGPFKSKDLIQLLEAEESPASAVADDPE